MKLFWKIFFSTMFISVTCLALGGYILLRSNLRTTLDSEVQTAYDYAEIACYSLANELETVSIAADDEPSAEQAICDAAQAVNIRIMNQTVAFAVVSAAGTVLNSSLPQTPDGMLPTTLGESQKGWWMRETADGVFVLAARPVLFFGRLYYMETCRDVSNLLRIQKQQYRTLWLIMIGIVFGAGIFTFFLSKLIIRRVTSLTRVTRAISNGNLGKRAIVRGEDEIAALSEDFNRMADSLEEKIGTLQEEAERKEMFIGAFSHELKTPLTSIIGYADMLRRKEMEREQLHICAEYIFTEGKRLETLSMKLLDLIVMKNREFTPVRVDIHTYLSEIAEMLTPQLHKAGIRLTCNAERALVSLEPDLMKTVFINLIDNARKAMEQAGQIAVTGRLQDGVYTVAIADTGKGMEQRELAKITQAFYMVDKSRSRQQGGAGLGLAICEEILKLHGFSIAFASTMGSGTTVTVTMKGEAYARQ